MTFSTPRLALTVLALAGTVLPALAQQQVNVYTLREPQLIKPMLDAFAQETGVKVNVVFAKEGLAERIASEGARSPADVLLTADVANLERAVELGVAAETRSETLARVVPPAYRDPQNRWFGLTYRARVAYVSKARVPDQALTYEELADPRWKGRLCTRDGQHVYNNFLFAAGVAHLGEKQAEAWINGLRANLARKPAGGDRDVAKDIAAGLCDVGLANTYYIGHMNRSAEQKPWAEAVRVVLPTFRNGGTHINLSGLAILKHAPNPGPALKLAEWLVGEKAQAMYSNVNFEFPVREGVPVDASISGFGPMRPDALPFATILKQRRIASDLVDKVGFNGGPGS